METEDQIKALPKLEQHIHIVGSVRPETLLWLVEEAGVEFPNSLKEVEQFFQYKDFDHFISVYSKVNDCITDERQFERIVYEMLEKEAQCNVKHVEAIFSTYDHVRRGLNHGLMIKALNRGIRKAREELGVGCTIRVDLVRNYGSEVGMKVLDLIEEEHENIVAIDLGGSEGGFPPAPYKEAFKRAGEMGLHLVAHAGEVSGPKSVWDAINYLGVERIGHGVSVSMDPSLLGFIKKQGITIEACPVSNVKTGVVPSINQHPIRRFYDEGLSVSVNSDDPSMFRTDMNQEYLQLNRELGFTVVDLFNISLNAVASSFLPETQKRRMIEEFQKEYLKIIA
ncbi:adenosine deaminase [Candidatus Bathyarchaeota archaeon]|nr:adenosine deaminase [Candidatus Bathyarchaeota archaeon]MBS7630829.1 adenosine deaminase [Candidatus Bathyarchaeota archaeon]